MKRKLMLLIFSSIILSGCSEESSESPAPFIEADSKNPTTLVGQYKVDYFKVQVIDNNNEYIITDNETIAKKGLISLKTDLPIAPEVLSKNVYSIQKENDENNKLFDFVNIELLENNTIFSFIAQLQIYNSQISSTLKNYAYQHIIFPFSLVGFNKDGYFDSSSKATVRGFNTYIVNPPYGNRNNLNSKVTIETELLEEPVYENGEIKKDEENKIVTKKRNVLKVTLMDNLKRTKYFFRLVKISNNPNAITVLDSAVGEQGGLYTTSRVKNSLIVKNFSESNISTFFNEFVDDDLKLLKKQ